MRLDGESPYHHTGPMELPSKIVEHNDNHLMINVLNIDNVGVQEGKHDLKPLIESKSFKETDPSQKLCCPGHDGVERTEDTEDMEASFCSPTSKSGVFEEVIDSCTDKKINESEMRSFRDGPCHVVKDICIDEGIHSVPKIVIENNELNQKNLINLNHPATNGDHDLAKEVANYRVKVSKCVDSSLAIQDKCISVPDKETEEVVFPGSLVDDGSKTDEVNETEGNISIEKTTLQLIPLEEFAMDSFQGDMSSFNSSNDQKQPVDQKVINQDKMEENSTAAETSAAEKLEKCTGSKETSADAEVESGVIVFNFDSRDAVTSGREESKETTDLKQSPQNLKDPGLEQLSNDGVTASARISFVHYSHGDSNLFGPASLSGPLTSSGRIPYSGSISHRSDESTTSARSFAFPILQSEWSSSPVKMAKAEHRGRLRRHRTWKMVLLCCRF